MRQLGLSRLDGVVEALPAVQAASVLPDFGRCKSHVTGFWYVKKATAADLPRIGTRALRIDDAVEHNV